MELKSSLIQKYSLNELTIYLSCLLALQVPVKLAVTFESCTALLRGDNSVLRCNISLHVFAYLQGIIPLGYSQNIKDTSITVDYTAG